MQEELEVLRRHHQGTQGRDLALGVNKVVSAEGLDQLRRLAQGVKVEETLLAYIASLSRKTREHPQVRLGASPRSSVALLQASKAYAALRGRSFATPDDVKAACPHVLRHRLALRPEAELDGLTPDALIAQLLTQVEIPR